MSLTLMQVADADTHPPGMHAKAAKVFQYWTAERRKNAIPRELVIDSRGLGYLRKKDGTLVPYGHRILSQSEISPRAKPSSDGDTTPPEITIIDPISGATIGASHVFKAEITDASGIKSASFVIQYPNGNTQGFNASKQPDSDIWSISFTGFSDGNWHWWVVAKDGASKGGNTKTSGSVGFTVDTTDTTSDSNSGDDTYIITNSEWTSLGSVQQTAGRIYFEMPKNAKRKGPWVGYVCSGTVVTDNEVDRSIILTAAHCVYDDVNKAFARNVLFIPQQNGTTGSGTDLNCDNDPIGCWAPAFGVVDDDWAIRTFPDNIAWDYAYYVTSDVGAHDPVSNTSSDNILDEAAGHLPVNFGTPYFDVDDGVAAASSTDFTHALGYSYSFDPEFRYCAQEMTTNGSVNWWLPSCELSGGSSGGPWIQPMDATKGIGDRSIISVNSWGYTNSPGMAGPILVDTSAECLLGNAKLDHSSWFTDPPSDGHAGEDYVC